MNQKYIEDYLKKSGDEKIIDKNYTENEYGFITYDIIGEVIFVYNCYGDGIYWNMFLEELAKRLNKKKIIITTKRNPKVVERRGGYKLEGYVMSKEV